MTKPLLLTADERKLFEDVASETYQTIGYDVWGDKTPSKAEYESVVIDKMYDAALSSEPLTDEQLNRWRNLSRAEKRRVVLAVGP